MANRIHYPVATGMGNEFILNTPWFVGNTSSNPTSFSDEITGVTRSGPGTFAVTLRHKYYTEVAPFAGVYGTTAGLQARISAWDAKAGTLTVVTERAGLAADTEADWTTGVVVANDTATLATAGYVVAVEATTASGAGAKMIQQTGTPAQGEVQVAYTDGVATLTFNSTDAVTAAAVLVVPTAGASTAAATDPATTDTIYLILATRNSIYSRP